jgi:hypothetical protein
MISRFACLLASLLAIWVSISEDVVVIQKEKKEQP